MKKASKFFLETTTGDRECIVKIVGTGEMLTKHPLAIPVVFARTIALWVRIAGSQERRLTK